LPVEFETISIVRDPLVIVDETTTEIGLGIRQGGVES
jgi:hypothetical protein